jgi:putative ABC transport system permease protein
MLPTDRFIDATRCLRRQPSFTGLVVLVIALGVGANAAVFTSVYGLLIADLPFNDAERIVVITETSNELDTGLVSPNAYLEWRDRNGSFTDLAAFMWWENGALGEGADAERVLAVAASRDFFRVLGVAPLLGRTFTDEDIKAGFASAMILSYDLWQRKFAGDPNVIGRTVLADGWQTPIVGVMPPAATNLATGWGDVWRPLRMRQEFDRTQTTAARYVRVIARLAPGITLEAARARAEAVQQRLQAEHPSVFAGFGVRLVTLRTTLVGEYRPASVVLMATAACLLLLTCASLANMLMARQMARARDVAVRVTVGASSRDLWAQLLSEHLVLALLGGLGGVGVYQAALGALHRWEPQLPLTVSLQPWVVLLVCLTLAGIAAMAASLPLLVASRDLDAGHALKEGGRTATPGAAAQQTRHRLVTAEVAMAVVLLIVSGTLLRSFVALLTTDAGFSPDRVLVVEMAIPEGQYSTGDQRRAYYRQLMESVSAVPGVESVGGLRYFPMHARLWSAAVQSTDNPLPPDQRPTFYWNRVAGDYFTAMGIPLLAGRWPTQAEMWERGGGVIVNQRAARRLFAAGAAVGRRLQVADSAPQEIVAVVGDVRQAGLGQEPKPEVYELMGTGEATGILSIAVRTETTPEWYVRTIESAIRGVNPLLPPPAVTPLTTFIGDTIAPRRVAARVGALFAALSLVLAALGIYALITQWVSQKTPELGIRLALGAGRGDVLRLVLREGLRLTFAGAALGVLASFALARLLGSWLSAAAALDWVTFVVAPAVLLLVAVVAALAPALRATAIDPVEALRAN